MSFSSYLQNKVLNSIFGSVPYTPPPILYIGLSTTTISDADGITEPLGNSYQRVALVNNTAKFPITSTGIKTHDIPIIFPQATGDWGTITDFFIADDLYLGNILLSGTLGESRIVVSGDIVSFAPDAINIILN